MYYELALISVAVAGGYWGWYFIRHQTTRLYGMLQLGAALLSLVGLLGRKIGESSLGIAGAVGVGAGVCLLVLGPLVRGFARRLAGAERFDAAKRMFDVAEILAPGSGVDDEKLLLAAMREIRDGNIETTVEALTAAKQRAPADARLAIDERIAMLYLAAYRWDEAITHAEAHLFGAIPAMGEASSSHAALRRALGIAPAVWVELLGAYGYVGDLDRAASMLARLEEVCAGRPDASVWLHRGRLIALALAGRVSAVQALVEPRRSRHMKPAARTYWLGVAYERHGEIAAAEAAYAKARSRSRGRPRILIDQALARLPVAKPVELSTEASAIIERVEATPPPAVTERMHRQGPTATRILAAAMIVTAATIALTLGNSADLGVLIRDGALVHTLVKAGQWWRLFTSIFVHAGGLHFLVNLVGLWMLGRLAEELFGSWRMAAIFALAGLGGAVASLLATNANISTGASGAILGLLGAVFAELTVHRKKHRLAWTRGVWGSLAVVALAQVGTDFMYRLTDHWAHAGGLVVGALAGLAFSPNLEWKNARVHAARVITAIFAAAVITSFAFTVRTSIVDSLTASPEFAVELVSPYDKMPATGNIDAYISGTANRAKENFSIERVESAPDTLVTLPAGWTGQEMIGWLPSELGDDQKVRIIVARAPDRVLTLYLPESVVRGAPEYFTWLIPRL
ncbi:MAG TPA: rhomboid family intramembrane serine protease [Kofleriaceae bacterium]|nr:rhomboid family intramembrane serine protease [Kofleriaceae bacterium]